MNFTPTPESPACKPPHLYKKPHLQRCGGKDGNEWQKNAKRKPESHGCKPGVWWFTGRPFQILLFFVIFFVFSAIVAGHIYSGPPSIRDIKIRPFFQEKDKLDAFLNLAQNLALNDEAVDLRLAFPETNAVSIF